MGHYLFSPSPPFSGAPHPVGCPGWAGKSLGGGGLQSAVEGERGPGLWRWREPARAPRAGFARVKGVNPKHDLFGAGVGLPTLISGEASQCKYSNPME